MDILLSHSSESDYASLILKLNRLGKPRFRTIFSRDRLIDLAKFMDYYINNCYSFKETVNLLEKCEHILLIAGISKSYCTSLAIFLYIRYSDPCTGWRLFKVLVHKHNPNAMPRKSILKNKIISDVRASKEIHFRI